MPDRHQSFALGRLPGDSRGSRRSFSIPGLILLLLGSLIASYLVTSRFGAQVFVVALSGLFTFAIFAAISFRDLFVPFLVWVLSIGGFSYLLWIKTPILPDLYLDRITMIWLAVVFLMKFFAEKRKLRGPYVLDIFIVLLVIYVLVQVIFHDMVAFHEWTMSYLVPGSAFFFAKNLVTKGKQVRILLWALLVLLFYYGVTSVAEKYQIHALIWPKYIIWEDAFKGRSDGPFKHAAVFGTIIGMMLPINLYFITTVRSVLLRAALFANLALGMAGLFFTYTRGAWLAGAAALLVVAVIDRRHYLRLLLPALVIVPVLAIGVLGFGEDKMMKERFENEDTLGSRIGTMVTATKVWRDNPLFGVGFYQYRFVMGDYIEPVEAPGLGTIRVSQFRHNPPHDIFIAYLAEQGLIWVFLQGGIYFLVFRTFVRHYKNRKPEDEFTNRVMPIFAGVFVGYLVGGLAFDYKFFSVVGSWFYICAGILYGYRPEDYYGSNAPAAAEPARPSLWLFPRSWTKRSPQVE